MWYAQNGVRLSPVIVIALGEWVPFTNNQHFVVGESRVCANLLRKIERVLSTYISVYFVLRSTTLRTIAGSQWVRLKQKAIRNSPWEWTLWEAKSERTGSTLLLNFPTSAFGHSANLIARCHPTERFLRRPLNVAADTLQIPKTTSQPIRNGQSQKLVLSLPFLWKKKTIKLEAE